MVEDVIGQELIPGDFVMMSDPYTSKLYPGVFVRHRGNYHIQGVGTLYGTWADCLQDWEERLESLNTTGNVRLWSCSWSHTNKRLIRVSPDSLPSELRSAIEIAKEILIRKRKIRI